jgi:UPF0042 nucleotide-binding protein
MPHIIAGMQEKQAKLIVVSGLSGSGKSIALNVLEDAGFNCIDNLPVSLFETLVRNLSKEQPEHLCRTAIGIDARIPDAELTRVPELVRELKQQGIDCEIVFLEADNDVLIQRFSETRRRHPLTDENNDLESAIGLEHQLLAPLRDAAHLQINTSRTTLHELRSLIRSRVAERESGHLSLMLQSFGFKHGAPRNADFVFDMRCLPNPHWHPDLRPLTGRDPAVAEFLEQDRKVEEMFTDVSRFLAHWVPCFESEGRSYLTIAIGCTGGQHRSVYMTERLKRFFDEQGRSTCLCTHRELS